MDNSIGVKGTIGGDSFGEEIDIKKNDICSNSYGIYYYDNYFFY